MMWNNVMMEKIRKGSFIKLGLSPCSKLDSLKQEFKGGEEQPNYINMNRNRCLFTYQSNILTSRPQQYYHDALLFKPSYVNDTIYPELFPLSNLTYAFVQEMCYVLVDEHQNYLFINRCTKLAAIILKVQVQQHPQYVQLITVHEYVLENDDDDCLIANQQSYRHINITYFHKSTHSIQQINIIFKYFSVMDSNQTILHVLVSQHDYQFVECVVISSIGNTVKGILLQGHGKVEVELEVEEDKIKSKYLTLRDEQKIVKVFTFNTDIYILTNEELYQLKVGPSSHLLFHPLRVCEKILSFCQKPIFSHYESQTTRVISLLDVETFAQHKLVFLASDYFLYVMNGTSIDHTVNLFHNIGLTSEPIAFNSMLIINEFLLVFSDTIHQQEDSASKSKHTVLETEQEKEKVFVGGYLFKINFNSLQYEHPYHILRVPSHKYQIKKAPYGYGVIVEYMIERKTFSHIYQYMSQVNIPKDPARETIKMSYRSQTHIPQWLYSYAFNGLLNAMLIMNHQETQIIIETVRQYRYKPLVRRKELYLNNIDFRQPVAIAIDAYGFNIFLAMKESVSFNWFTGENLICIGELQLSNVKFAKFEEGVLIASSLDAVYILNPWEIKIMKKYKTMGKVFTVNIQDGIVWILCQQNKETYLQIIPMYSQNFAKYSIHLGNLPWKQLAFTVSFDYLIIVSDSWIRLYAHSTKSLFRQIKADYNTDSCQYPTVVRLSRQLGYLLVGSSLGVIRQYIWPLEDRNIQCLKQKICESRIQALVFNYETFSEIKILLKQGSILTYKIQQYLGGKKMHKVFVQPKHSEYNKKMFSSNKFNDLGQYQITPKNHIPELCKIQLQQSMNYETAIIQAEQEKQKNSLQQNKHISDFQESLKEIRIEFQRQCQKHKALLLRSSQKTKKNHDDELNAMDIKKNIQFSQNSKELKTLYNEYDQLRKQKDLLKTKFRQKLKIQKEIYEKELSEQTLSYEQQYGNRFKQFMKKKQNNFSDEVENTKMIEQMTQQQQLLRKNLLIENFNKERELLAKQEQLNSSIQRLKKSIAKTKDKIEEILMIKMEMEMQLNQLNKSKNKKLSKQTLQEERIALDEDELYIQRLHELENKQNQKIYQNQIKKKDREMQILDKEEELKQLKVYQHFLNQSSKILNDQILKERNSKISSILDINLKVQQINKLKQQKKSIILSRMKIKIKIKSFITQLLNNFKEYLYNFNKKENILIHKIKEDENNQFIQIKKLISYLNQRLNQKRILADVGKKKKKLEDEAKKINPINNENRMLVEQFNELQKKNKNLQLKANELRQKKVKSMKISKTKQPRKIRAQSYSNKNVSVEKSYKKLRRLSSNKASNQQIVQIRKKGRSTTHNSVSLSQGGLKVIKIPSIIKEKQQLKL